LPQQTGVSYSQTELEQLSLILGVLFPSGKYNETVNLASPTTKSLLVKIK
jgi:hypothetical protein